MQKESPNHRHVAAAIEINAVENTADTESRIRDTDMAKELMEMIKESILTKVGMPILAQANVSAEGVTLLLRKS